ncbi:hypothetical protein [Microbulbifer sp. GL-2]|uniref:hypothetical protein n=1 Tax=Microbulbifer sp. GL-2 TaxID=2591606 RepID=UPI001162441B|nr:hypothetical protein [Microbulbifer sp. GL-2]BBM02525.1 hypothetical protein GL2_25990 [Microbulbifer sp. GL-2]
MRDQKISIDGVGAVIFGFLYLCSMLLAAISFLILILAKRKSQFKKLTKFSGCYSLFIGIMGILSNVFLIFVYLSPRQGLKLDPPGEDGIYITSILAFLLITFFSFIWSAFGRLLINVSLLTASVLVIGLMVHCVFSQSIPIQDYLIPGSLALSYICLFFYIRNKVEAV